MEKLQRISLIYSAICPHFAFFAYLLFCPKNGVQEAASSNLVTRTKKVRYFGKNYRNSGLFVYYTTSGKWKLYPPERNECPILLTL